MLLEVINQAIEHFLAQTDSPRVARVGVIGQRNVVGEIVEAPDGLELPGSVSGGEFHAVVPWAGCFGAELPLPIIQRIQKTAHLAPIAGAARRRRDNFRLPLPLMN